ncbi:mitochondrial 39-S ribosomal protein L47 (MRP-L47)-domain-containing protein [Cercophora newfieldiana]|uniref:Large ribosomal subunit protein uL29m n=1 Tax=Cercophora newfieldiana TaxID=92897 RepID=A0AA39Y034_9PEZI|nr:mitochondrial 39-S ribosomal protein L47 (MRP-L47)-domain-containing protein [Cercophora newfieldiana]
MASPAAIRPSVGAALHSCRTASVGYGLRPLGAAPSRIHAAGISTTASMMKRHKYPGARDNKDHNKTRGESALRRTGTRWRLSVSDEPLPKPVAPEDLVPVETDPNHGLWEFFASREAAVSPPAEDAKHGRGWMVEELRGKSWEDLHKLWWVCVKERNRISTASYDRNRNSLGFGDAEARARDNEVKVTMRGIKHVLTERQYAWEDAVKLAENDPEIDLSGDGPVFTPSEFLEEEVEETAEVEEVDAKELALDGAESVKWTPDAAAAAPPPSEPKAQGEAPRL